MIALKIAIKFLNNDNDKEYGYYSEKHQSLLLCGGGGGDWGQPKDGLVTSTDNVRLGGGGGWGEHPKDALVTSTDNVRGEGCESVGAPKGRRSIRIFIGPYMSSTHLVFRCNN